MASLSQRLRESKASQKKEKKLSPFVLPEAESVLEEDEDLVISEPECEPVDVADATNKYENCLFISDRKISKNIKNLLHEFDKIHEYDNQLFCNRSPESLKKDYNVENIWINLKYKKARVWCGKQLKKNETYAVVVAYSGKKTQKWISDLEDSKKVDVCCKIEDLHKLKSLDLNEFVNNLSNVLNIHSPASPLMACLGLSNKITRKQK